MYLAQIIGFLKTLLWIAIAWFIVKTISRMFSSSKMGGSKGPQRSSARQPGDVSIERNTPPKASKADENAEFVDFEELNDHKSTQ